MKQIIIYGAGNTGKSAYYYFKTKEEYEILFFVDSDKNKWGKTFEGMEIKQPDILKRIKDAEVIIASVCWAEIMENIRDIGGLAFSVYNPTIKTDGLNEDIISEVNKRTIDLGAFLKEQKEIVCKELTFIPGGSLVLDYAFLKALAVKYNCRTYLEIGTYIGESINVLTDCCDKLYSVTMPKKPATFINGWSRNNFVPDYTGRLINREKIVQFFTDSKTFDFSQIEDEIDLYFIDGDHTYNGIYTDTKNIFKRKKENAIVVWHDFREGTFRYREETVRAVKDALGDKFKNVYGTNCNLCGVYLPDAYIEDFEMRILDKYEETARLYSYDVLLSNCQVK